MQGLQVWRNPVAVARRLGLCSNPLCRTWDRIEGIAVILLLSAALAAVPISLSVGSIVYGQAVRDSAQQAAGRHQATAVMLRDAPGNAANADGAARTVDVAATWSGPAGVERTGEIAVRPGTRAGAQVTVWLDASGAVVDRPLAGSHGLGRAVLAGSAVLGGCLLGLVFVYEVTRWLLDRTRAAFWAAEWARVEPGWTQRTS